MKIVQCVSSMMITLLSGVVLMQLLCVTAEGLTTVAVSGVMSAVDNTTCEYIRIECALHEGCNQALQNYFEKCDRILKANSTTCPESCMNALVALTSTVQGSGLLDCKCKDHYCEEMKSRVEVCRPYVIEAARNETIVSCELAQWICQVDQVCSAAISFFQRYCKRVLQGDSCSLRCLNSAEILQRQEKALKMNRCQCTGKTTVECLRNKERMVRLCYGVGNDQQQVTGGSNKSKKIWKKHRPKMFELDPDRAEIEMMIADVNYEPEGWHAGTYNSTISDTDTGDTDTGENATDKTDVDDDNESASGVRVDVSGALVIATVVFLFTRSSLVCIG